MTQNKNTRLGLRKKQSNIYNRYLSQIGYINTTKVYTLKSMIKRGISGRATSPLIIV